MFRFLITLLFTVTFVQDESTIKWDHSYRLEWSDFRGDPTNQEGVVAVTASGLSFSYSTKRTETELIDYSFEVYADFYPEKSWCLKDRVNNNILNHERLHFDITELHARKFRKRIKNTTFTINIGEEMEAIHNTINAELEAMQNKYDKETRHSQDIEKQKEWQANIVLQLNKLAYYSS